MKYKHDDGFDMKEISEEDLVEVLNLHRWAIAYASLDLVILIAATITFFKHHYGFAILMFLLSQIAGYCAGEIHRNAHRILDE